jgi:hypothetical protein
MTRFRLLLLGNSHLASLKLGWDEIADQYPGMECVFFGGPAQWTKHAVLDAGTIKVTHAPLAKTLAQVSGGATTVMLADFDAVCVVGMYFGFGECLLNLRRVHTHVMPPLRPNSQLVSRACLKQIIHDSLAGSPAFEWASMIKRDHGKPVLLAPTPLSSEARLHNDPFIKPVAVQFRGYIADIFDMFKTIARGLTASNDLILVEQPPHTVAFTGFTKSEYSRGSIRLLGDGIAHREEDYTHMNKLYGTEMLPLIFAAAAPGRYAAASSVTVKADV